MCEAVDIGVGHQNDAMITKLRKIEIFLPDTVPSARISL
jgi:hypothetical protein